MMQSDVKLLKTVILTVSVLNTEGLFTSDLVFASPASSFVAKMPDRYEEMITKTVKIMSIPLNLQRGLEFLKSEIAMLLRSLTVSAANVNLKDNPQANQEILDNILKVCANLNVIIDGKTKSANESISLSENKQLQASDIISLYEQNAQKFVDIQTQVIKLLGRVNWLQDTLQKLVQLIASDAINMNATIGEKEENLQIVEEEVKEVNQSVKTLIPNIEKAVDECKTLIKETEKIAEERKKTKEAELKKEQKESEKKSEESENKNDNESKKITNKEKTKEKTESKEKDETLKDTDDKKSKKETKSENKNKKDNEETKEKGEKEEEINKKDDNKKDKNKKDENKEQKDDKKKIEKKKMKENEQKQAKCTCTCDECKEFRKSKANSIEEKESD